METVEEVKADWGGETWECGYCVWGMVDVEHAYDDVVESDDDVVVVVVVVDVGGGGMMGWGRKPCCHVTG